MASPQRFARWKRLGSVHKLAITGLMPLGMAATVLSALPAQAVTDTKRPPGFHLMWVTPTAARIGWPASPAAKSYTYRLYQMDGVRVRSGSAPGYYHTVTYSGLHPGWRYRAEVRANPGGPGVALSIALPGLHPPRRHPPGRHPGLHPSRFDPPREVAYQWAETQAGARYVYGGQGDGGYDCSGLVRTAYSHAGIWLPRTTDEMLQYWRLDQESAPRQGDLVFFGTGHVELYAGPDQSFGAESSATGTWWNRWWPGGWWPTAFYRVSGAG